MQTLAAVSREAVSPERLIVGNDTQIRASVIIVSYNAREKLISCLRSVLDSLPEDCELLVIDNASSEGNADAVETEFPQVLLMRSETNLGFGAGANRAASRARGRFLAFINPDTSVAPGWLESLIDAVEREPLAALATPQILMSRSPELINTCGCVVHISGLALCRGLRRPEGSYSKRDEVGAISGAAFVIRKNVFNLLGGFDEEMFLYVEDIDLSWRARLAGWRTIYEPASVVFHDYELKITGLKMFWQERNRYLMLLKSLKWQTLFVLLPVYLLAEAVTWGFVLLRDRRNLGNKLSAVGWVLANWRIVLRGRRATQSIRATTDRQLLKSTSSRIEFSQGASGSLSRLASLVFDPLFFALRALALALVWW